MGSVVRRSTLLSSAPCLGAWGLTMLEISRPPPRPTASATAIVPAPAKNAVVVRMARLLVLAGNVRAGAMFRWNSERRRGPLDHRGDLVEANDAGQRAHFVLLVFAQLQ